MSRQDVTTLPHAFKEWAVICRALELGKQAIILRKGGIAEDAGSFRMEHTRFWLYPTFTHQQRDGIKEEAAPLFEEAERDRPTAGKVRLALFAEAAGIYHIHELPAALMLQSMHFWSEETVAQRFRYRTPGLYVIAVRVFRATTPTEIVETPAQAGCKSWVELDQPLATEGAVPVLEEEKFQEILHKLDDFLRPTALA